MSKKKLTGQNLFRLDETVEKSTVAAAQPDAAKIFSIAEFLEVLNIFFRREEIRITGEISELKRAASGHVYFTIKDKGAVGSANGGGFNNNSAVMDSIIWSRNYQLCGVALEVGMEVVLTGHPNIYPPSGRLSFCRGYC